MAQSILRGRHSARLDGDFVVLLIGMRINKPWKVHRWLPIYRAMPKMIEELNRDPVSGLLGVTSGLLGGGPAVIQYWRSLEDLERFARDPSARHLPAWRAFNQQIRGSADVGLWHETYRVRAGEYEAIYVDVPPTGLARAADHEPLEPASTAAERIGARPHDDVSVTARIRGCTHKAPAFVAALIAVAIGALGAAPAVAVTTKDVAVIDFDFVPGSIAVMPGDSVRWTYNSGFAPHNVVFEDAGFSEPASPAFAVWTRTRTFASTGTYRYYCAQHGGPGGVGMAGVVVVNQIGNIPPRAVLTATPSLVEVNATVSFGAAGSADPDGTITKYEWDLDGDGTYEVDSGTTATTSRSYSTPGRRNVTVRVTDNVGTSTVSDIRAVVVTNAPTASFSLSPNPAASGQAVTFDASASTDTDGTIAEYEWDLDGNGTFEVNGGRTATTSKSYTGPATLTVRLRVTDDVGFSTMTSRSLEIQAPVPAPLPPPALPAPPPPPVVPPPPPPVGVAAVVNCSTLTGDARAACMQKACASRTGTKKAACISNSCRYLKAAKRASCIQTSCRYVAKSKRASCGRASCRYLPAAKRKLCLRKYPAPARRR